MALEWDFHKEEEARAHLKRMNELLTEAENERFLAEGIASRHVAYHRETKNSDRKRVWKNILFAARIRRSRGLILPTLCIATERTIEF